MGNKSSVFYHTSVLPDSNSFLSFKLIYFAIEANINNKKRTITRMQSCER